MEEQKAKARDALRKKEESAWGHSNSLDLDFNNLSSNVESKFLGYECCKCQGKILYILKDGGIVDEAMEGDNVTIILDKTPFYAESGGQVGDTGFIETEIGLVRVEDCKKTPDGKHIQLGVVEKGVIAKGQRVEARVDLERREAIARNHTATHLIQKALRNILGEHVTQAGSLVEAERLRFDFTHFEPISENDLRYIEEEVNSKILEDIPVDTEEMNLDEAKAMGAMALFGEKYGSKVRVVKIGDYSFELCGGTHIASTAKIGPVKILSETGIAAGTRRIEAVSGHYALVYYREREKLIEYITAAIKTTPQDAVKKIETLMGEIKNAHKEIEQLRNKLVVGNMNEMLSKAIKVNGTTVVAEKFNDMDMEALRNTSDMLKSKLSDGVIIIASEYNDKVNLVTAATKDAVKKGIHSGNIIKEVAKITGGGGGGRPDMAQAGGKDPSKIEEALHHAVEMIKNQLG